MKKSPDHEKGSHPNAAAHAAKGIQYYGRNAGGTWSTTAYPTQHEARAYAGADGLIVRTLADHEVEAPAEA